MLYIDYCPVNDLMYFVHCTCIIGTLEQHQFLPSYPLQECTFQNSALLATEANTETSLSHKGTHIA